MTALPGDRPDAVCAPDPSRAASAVALNASSMNGVIRAGSVRIDGDRDSGRRIRRPKAVPTTTAETSATNPPAAPARSQASQSSPTLMTSGSRETTTDSDHCRATRPEHPRCYRLTTILPTGEGRRRTYCRFTNSPSNRASRCPKAGVDAKSLGPSGRGSRANARSQRRIPPTDRGATNGTPASDQARFTGRRHGTATTSFRHRRLRVRERLVAPDRTPIAGATIEVLAQLHRAGSRFRPIGSARTSPKGGFSFKAAPGASRTLRFGYRSHVNDPAYTATLDVLQRVRARATLSASRRFVVNGGAGTLPR